MNPVRGPAQTSMMCRSAASGLASQTRLRPLAGVQAVVEMARFPQCHRSAVTPTVSQVYKSVAGIQLNSTFLHPTAGCEKKVGADNRSVNRSLQEG